MILMKEIKFFNSPLNFFKNNRIPIYAIWLAIVIFGILSLLFINLDLVPDIEYPQLTVVTNYPNATPEEVKNLVTIPIERAVYSLKGVESVNSISRQSFSIVKIRYKWGTNLNVAHIELREKLDLAVADFPREVNRPTILNFQLSQSPVYAFVVSSIDPDIDSRTLYQFVRHNIVSDIEGIKGVSKAELLGGDRPEIDINIDPKKMVKYSVGPREILASISSFGKNRPVGFLKKGNKEYSVRLEGSVKDYQKYGDIVVKNDKKGSVAVKNIANITYGSTRKRRDILLGKREVLAVYIYKQPGTNIVKISRRIKIGAKELENQYGGIVRFEKIFDGSIWVKRSLTELGVALGFGILLTIFSVWIWMRSLKISLLIILTIPLSMLATFILMKLLGISINILTLGGFSLAIGMIVDNSVIIVTSAIVLPQNDGKSETRYKGTTASISYKRIKNAVPAVTSATLTTVVVFLPVLFLSGVLKIFFMMLSLIMVSSLIFSLFASITIIPVILSDMNNIGCTNPRFLDVDYFTRRLYRKALKYLFRHSYVYLLILLIISSLGFLNYHLLDKRLMDPYPQDFFFVKFFIKRQVSIKYTKIFVRRIINRINSIKGIRRIITTIGEDPSDPGQNLSGIFGVNSGVMKFYIVDKNNIYKKISEIKRAVEGFNEADFLFTIPDNPVQRIVSRSDFDVKIKVYGNSKEKIKSAQNKLYSFIEGDIGRKNLISSSYRKSGEDVFTIKREFLPYFDVTISDIGEFLKLAVSGVPAGSWVRGGFDIPIRLKLKEGSIKSPGDILNLYLINRNNSWVKLSNLAEVKNRKAIHAIFRENQRDYGWIGINEDSDKPLNKSSGKISLKSFFIHDKSSMYDRVKRFCRENSIDFGWDDQFTKFKENSRALWISLLLAIFLEYVILVASFNSFTRPIIVMGMVVLSLGGILLILLIMGSSININSFMSIIVLIGLLVNNGIMLFLEYTRRDVKSESDIIEASVIRLKPIMITTLSTILALIPGLFTSNRVQISLSLTIIFGLLYSTSITLLFLPVFYRIFYIKKNPV